MFRCKRVVVLTFACLHMLFSHNIGVFSWLISASMDHCHDYHVTMVSILPAP